ncbi:terminase family protein [Vibrio sp. RE88]|uniref:terminase large subunit domain-containing protein n=1 Tax=Vibrio sp. RE88 TaxID=2607610 RepID=UPI00149329A7|nr:terminase family protein [Vibrio sp. RE88]NOH61131.1 hypothetical protein [Vibrio sp. RE88]
MMNKESIELYFSGQALGDAMLTQENQIFLSASSKDSEKIQNHIANLASSLGLNLSGNPFVLPNGATLTFLQTDSKVAGGHSGNAYVINCFDEDNFSYISNLVSSWTMLKKHKAAFVSIE